MDKLLRLYTYVDGGANDTPFPSADNPIEIGAFRYDAKRMGGAPTITASVNYASCLDDEWTYDVYAMFNGEKFYLKQIPTSSYNNTSAMYKHDIELVSERVALDNVYFFDVVSDDIVDDDKPVSNSTKVVFFGDVREFANRLKASLQYSALDYDVVVDANVVSEEKLVSFEDQFFSNVLQEIYNTYEVPYYFEGKTIHIGYSKSGEALPSFAYGVDDALLSISKNNANYKVVNRATGTGSSENIPFYYPNNSPKGNIRAELNTASDDFSIEAVDLPTFSNKIDLEGVIEAKMVSLSVSSFMLNDEEYTLNYMPQAHITVNSYQIYRDNVAFVAYSSSAVKGKFAFTIRLSHGASEYMAKIYVGDKTLDPVSVVDNKINFEIEVNFEKAGNKEILAEVALSYIPQGHSSIRRAYNVVAGSGLGWFYKDKAIELKNVGIKYQGTPSEGDKITQKLIEYINTSQTLMPSKYRDTKGAERFYNATNDTYEGVTFNNPFVAGKPKEHIVKIEDIKPSIEGMLVNGQRIDMFEAFAYDVDDNDETYEDEDGSVYFKHPYFFAKLKPLGFNLFDHAIEQQPMTISFTSGACGACNFEIAVDEESQKNTVQVDDNGNLVYDENGRVLCGVEGSEQGEVQPQDIQQDTTSHSVWIALRKEEVTYGILMPKAPANGAGGHRPTTDDTFVILGINLPDEYILNAERRLEAEIIKYLQDNNDEKFTFSIGFSRIYFAENEDVLNSLNENSKIQITYDNKTYDLYVSSFSYTMSESDALPEIKVELDETLKTSQNAIQKAINEVKTTLGSAINEVSQGVAMQRRSYVSKVQDDTAMGVVDFSKGVKFGEGGKVEILDNNSAKLTIEYLEVTKKATFTSLEIQEKTHVGGQMLVTPASMNCGEVEEFEGFYRCYFQTKGADGSEEIFNQFAIGDQAICQTFNAWGSKYYWRLVVGVGEDYIDLSKEDCDEGSGVPEAGDRIIQMGNRDNADRQNAIVIAAHGDNSPYIVQYKGINNFDLPNSEDDERITTLLSPTKNVLTGTVKMQAGSKGLEMFEEWAEVEAALGNIEGLETIKEVIENNFTAITGGLIQSGLLMLGYYDEAGKYHVMSGTNGVYDANATGGGIAAWYGGAMSEDSAKTVLRFDGSGFFANKNITWDNEGGASFAGGKITITKEGALTFSDTIAFGSGGDSVSTVLEKLSTLLSYFTLKGNELSTNYQVRIKNNLIVEQDTSSGGTGQDTPSAGLDEEQLQDYLDLHKYVTESRVQEMIDEVAAGDVDLTNYYTKQEVDAKIPSLEGYAKTAEVDKKINELNLSQYAKASDLDALQAEVDNIDAVLGLSETAEGYINTWAEVKAFLDGFDKDNPDLAEILQGMDDEIAKKVDKTLFDSLAATVTQHNEDIGKLDTRLTTAEGEIDTLQTYTTWLDSVKGLIYKDGDNIKINTSLIVVGDTSSGGSGQDTPASGTVTGIKVGPLSTDILTPNNAGIIDMVPVLSSIDVSDQLTAYAKTEDVNAALLTKQDTISDLATIRSGAAFGATALQSITKTMVTDALGYTPLSTGGGTMSGTAQTMLTINSSNTFLCQALLQSAGENKARFGWSGSTAFSGYRNGVFMFNNVCESSIGIKDDGTPYYNANTLIHSGNYATEIGDYYLKSSGGTIEGTNMRPLIINTTSSAFELQLQSKGNPKVYVGWNSTTDGAFFQEGTSTKYIGIKTDGTPYFHDTAYHTLIHNGNIGSYNAGSADVIAKTYANENINYAYNESKIRLIRSTVSNSTELGFPDSYTSGISVMTDYTGWQMVTYGSIGVPNPFFRSFGDDGRRSEWKQLAFLTDNVASATKLAGTYHGSADVSSNPYFWLNESGKTRYYLQAYNGNLCIGPTEQSFIINASGNVTIGGSDLASTNYKLYVNGSGRFGHILINKGYGSNVGDDTIEMDSAGATLWMQYYHNGGINMCAGGGSVTMGGALSVAGEVTMSSTLSVGGNIKMADNTHLDGGGNHLIFTSPNYTTFGMGSKSSYLDGREIYLRTSGATAVTIASNGAVTMSSTLSVGGNTTINGTITLPVNYQIQWGTTGYMIYGTASSIQVDAPLQVSGATTVSSTLSVGDAITISSGRDGKLIFNNTDEEGYTEIRFQEKGSNYNVWIISGKECHLGNKPVKIGSTLEVSGKTTISNDLVVSGDTSSGSDIRFKDIIKNKTIKIADIAKAPLFTFKWNDREDDTIHLGSSAQYWEKVTPWLVKGEDFKTLDYSTLGVAMGISLAKKAVNHEERIKVLEKEIKRLKEEMIHG